MRRFYFDLLETVSPSIKKTIRHASGVLFPGGSVVVKWLNEDLPVDEYATLEALKAAYMQSDFHIIWLDEESDRERRRLAGTHQRWIEKTTRSHAHPDEHWRDQCLHCAFYKKLSGHLGTDWGVCANPASAWDGQLRFEHDGCSAYVEAENEIEEK